MPTVDIEENIQKLRMNIEKMTQEIFRLQGMLQTFEGFKKGGLKTDSSFLMIQLKRLKSSRVSKRNPSNYQHSKPP